MSGILGVEITGAQEAKASLETMPDRVYEAMVQAVMRETLRLQRRVVEKLSGEVLNVITGALRRSIQANVEQDGSKVIGHVYSSGDVKYAAIHEFGFDGQEQVRQHIRTMVFGHVVDPFSVGPYQRTMHMPERSFLRSSAAELKDSVIENVGAAVRAVAKGGTASVSVR